MGETVHCGSFLSSMRDLSEDISNTCSYSMYCGGDKTLPYGQYQNGFSARPPTDSYERDFLKQTMLEHEAVFKNQVLNNAVRVSHFTRMLWFFMCLLNLIDLVLINAGL
jgi:hypothetical protein